MRTLQYKGHTIEIHTSWYSVRRTNGYGYLKADTLDGAKSWIDAMCEHCGEFHDVEIECRASGSGHDNVQASTIYECDKAQYPNDELFSKDI